MNDTLQIGITGGIGSGKSLICKIFSSLGVPVYDADSHAKELMTTDGILVSEIRKEFGDLSYLSDGALNRTYLSKVVFNQQEKLKVLNALVHPRVAHHYAQWLAKQKDQFYVVKEAALLVETGSFKTLDQLIVVLAPERTRIHRVMSRDTHRTEQEVKDIISKQMSDEEKVKHANFTIVNDDTVLVIPQVLTLHQRFISMNR